MHALYSNRRGIDVTGKFNDKIGIRDWGQGIRKKAVMQFCSFAVMQLCNYAIIN
jgi:hypothetical protein